MLDEWRIDAGAPGAVLCVRLADGRTVAVASGRTDDRGGRPVEPSDRFRIGSITKTYVATLILQLVEEGLVGLDEPLAGHLPDIPHARRVTVRQLLNHTSGMKEFGVLAEYRERLLRDPGRAWEAADVLDLVADRPLDYEPGEGWSYSNTNYVLLGMLGEEVTGAPLAELLRSRILLPLQHADTYLEGLEDAPRLRVNGHFDLDGDGEPENVRLVPYTALVTSGAAAGALSASASDVAGFAAALMAGRLVGRGSLDAMMELAPGSDTGAAGYGLGLMRFERDGREAWGHAGGLPGFSALVAHSTTDGITIVGLANQSEVEIETLAQRAADEIASLPGAVRTAGRGS